MTRRTFRHIAITFCLLLVAVVPAQADPVQLSDVVQVISGNPRYGGQAPTLQLRYAPQEDKTQRLNSTPASDESQQQQNGDQITTTQQDPPSTDGAPVQAQSEEVSEIAITDCECGELPDEIVEIPGGRSKLPFLPLIGLICVTGICTGDETPTPTPPGEPIPEPATLLLFGSGLVALGAGARRRYARAKQAKQATTTEEG